MSERKYYVLCENNCKFESMTKEQILTAIEQAISTGEIGDCDTGFITRIKEQNNGAGLTFWVGTQAEYNALDPKVNNCFYIITDDTTTADIAREIETLKERLSPVEEKQNTMNAVLWTGQVEVGDIMDNIWHACNNIHKYNLFALKISNKANTVNGTLLAYKENNNVSGAVLSAAGFSESVYRASIDVKENKFFCNKIALRYLDKDEDEEAYLIKIIGIM